VVAHEIAGVFVATLVALVFVSALQPNSQMATILSSATSGWSSILKQVGAGAQGTAA
jgi:hypothetical protein